VGGHVLQSGQIEGIVVGMVPVVAHQGAATAPRMIELGTQETIVDKNVAVASSMAPTCCAPTRAPPR
jgi:hypothetical protein